MELRADRTGNSDEYTIVEDEVQEGDVVIVTGNVNLAHEAPVKVIENKNKRGG